MPVPRFYCPGPLAAGATIDLPEAVAHHALRVLRLRPGEAIALFDGTGGEYPARLAVEGKTARAALGEFDPREAEPPTRITLVQGLPGGDKMDWIVEKAVELGAHRIVPVAARRSVLQLSGARLDKRLDHWRRVARAACEQCGRNRLPQVDAPLSLADWLATAQGPQLLCDPAAEAGLPAALAALAPADGLTLLVGPEGGWSDEELESARRHGARPVRLGDRVLRTETAGLALLAAAGALLGWY